MAMAATMSSSLGCVYDGEPKLSSKNCGGPAKWYGTG